jgi:hypothetical protein
VTSYGNIFDGDSLLFTTKGKTQSSNQTSGSTFARLQPCCIDAIGRGVVIGSAWRCETFQPSPSRRKIMVTRRAPDPSLPSMVPANRSI